MMRATTRPRLRGLVVVLLTVSGAFAGAAPAGAATAPAQDAFGRTVAAGLGTADAGGAWTSVGYAADFSVSGGVGRLRVGRGVTRAAHLASVALTDVDAAATFATAAAPTGGGVYETVTVRRREGSEYAAHLGLGASGAVTVGLARDGTALASVAVTGWTAPAGTQVRLRVQAVGTNPTTLGARVWRVGTPEPTTWQVSATDATSALQGPGAVGLRSYLSSSATTTPLVSTVDDLVVTVPASRPTQAQWLADVTAVLGDAAAYVDSQQAVPRPAIVLDIDNTALQSYYQPFAATPATSEVARRAQQDGYAVLFATGRSADGGGTRGQLTRAGYRVDDLCFRDPTAASIEASKTACRAAWTAQGYTVVANIGNHTTDLNGPASGRTYLLPSYGFLD